METMDGVRLQHGEPHVIVDGRGQSQQGRDHIERAQLGQHLTRRELVRHHAEQQQEHPHAHDRAEHEDRPEFDRVQRALLGGRGDGAVLPQRLLGAEVHYSEGREGARGAGLAQELQVRTVEQRRRCVCKLRLQLEHVLLGRDFRATLLRVEAARQDPDLGADLLQAAGLDLEADIEHDEILHDARAIRLGALKPPHGILLPHGVHDADQIHRDIHSRTHLGLELRVPVRLARRIFGIGHLDHHVEIDWLLVRGIHDGGHLGHPRELRAQPRRLPDASRCLQQSLHQPAGVVLAPALQLALPDRNADVLPRHVRVHEGSATAHRVHDGALDECLVRVAFLFQLIHAKVFFRCVLERRGELLRQ
mmetsp:Transcript_76852/g.235215  ORF Transcript_76852/g.235215 Transcript_76852/m.235215 type:complete len:363 (+) Transcript_76852:1036-2124(+)